jgi:hypothetical protein
MRLAMLTIAFHLAFLCAAEAQPAADITWDAPGSCPDVEAVHARVRAWLAPGSAAPDLRELQVVARVSKGDGQYVLTLDFRSPSGSGHEQIRALSCATLVSVVALKVALAADYSVAAREPPARDLPGPGMPVRAYTRLSLGGGARVLPGFAPELAAFVGASWRMLGAELGLSYLLPRDRSYPDHPDIGGRFQALAAEARVCLLPTLGRSQWPLCVGGLAGTMRADGYGAERARASRQWWAAVPLTLAVRWPVGSRWALWWEASTLVSLLRPAYYVRQLGQLHRPDRVGVRGQFGVEVHFR